MSSLNKENKIVVTDLLNFMKEQNDDVVQGAWFPDSILKDNSTGHVWRHRQPLEDEITIAKIYARTQFTRDLSMSKICWNR